MQVRKRVAGTIASFAAESLIRAFAGTTSDQGEAPYQTPRSGVRRRQSKSSREPLQHLRSRHDRCASRNRHRDRLGRKSAAAEALGRALGGGYVIRAVLEDGRTFFWKVEGRRPVEEAIEEIALALTIGDFEFVPNGAVRFVVD